MDTCLWIDGHLPSVKAKKLVMQCARAQKNRVALLP
jgi:hypothetical protein